MPGWIRRVGVLLMATGVLLAAAGPVSASSTTLISGVGVYAAEDQCPALPAPDSEFINPIAMTGSLVGCWYTRVDPASPDPRPNGMYRESGEEIFVGSLVDDASIITGTFRTTYRFWAKFTTTPPFAEIRGHCVHPIVSGTGGFAGVGGRVLFKDILQSTGWTFPYRGNIKF